VLYAVRLPRVILGGLIGAGLAVSGAAMQGLFRNPLADPGLIGVSSVAALTASASEYRGIGTDEITTFLAGAQIWWTRLTYSNAQTYAMHAFDANEPGASLSLAGYALVPRILYPNKPVMSIGDKYTEFVTGNATSTFTGPGIFAEAYWNGGWILVVGIGVFVGVILAGMGLFSVRAISSGRFVYLPIIFIGLIMGLRPDDWFVLVYIGGLIQAAVLYLMIMTFAHPLIVHTSLVRV